MYNPWLDDTFLDTYSLFHCIAMVVESSQGLNCWIPASGIVHRQDYLYDKTQAKELEGTHQGNSWITREGIWLVELLFLASNYRKPSSDQNRKYSFSHLKWQRANRPSHHQPANHYYQTHTFLSTQC